MIQPCTPHKALKYTNTPRYHRLAEFNGSFPNAQDEVGCPDCPDWSKVSCRECRSQNLRALAHGALLTTVDSQLFCTCMHVLYYLKVCMRLTWARKPLTFAQPGRFNFPMGTAPTNDMSLCSHSSRHLVLYIRQAIGMSQSLATQECLKALLLSKGVYRICDSCMVMCKSDWFD